MRRFADLVVDPDTLEVRRGDREIDLTPTEHDLLLAFLDEPRRVLSKEALLERVRGFASDTEPNTVEVYVGYLRRKLEADGAPRLIHTVRGFGYVLREPWSCAPASPSSRPWRSRSPCWPPPPACTRRPPGRGGARGAGVRVGRVDRRAGRRASRRHGGRGQP